MNQFIIFIIHLSILRFVIGCDNKLQDNEHYGLNQFWLPYDTKDDTKDKTARLATAEGCMEWSIVPSSFPASIQSYPIIQEITRMLKSICSFLLSAGKS